MNIKPIRIIITKFLVMNMSVDENDDPIDLDTLISECITHGEILNTHYEVLNGDEI